MAGVEVHCLDLSVEDFDPGSVSRYDAVAFSVPMHTAMRLAVVAARRIKAVEPDMPVAFYGLYADVGREQTLGTVADALLCGEYEPALVAWATQGEGNGSVLVELGKTGFIVPDRTGLPSLDRYARLERDGDALLAGAVEATHGCRHRCRHCPIPAVYDGRLRVVGNEPILADIDQLYRLGARHVTFADADFLNAPAYSMGLLREAHEAHPDLTYDVTVKVEHILKHRDLWPEMARLGVLFVVSAFESVDDRTLQILEKGHSTADMLDAIDVLSEAGIHLRPTWLPFVPWTTPDQIADLFEFVDQNGLAGAVDPVQMAIKVLVPEGSLLLQREEMQPYLRHFDADALTWLWEFESPETERLQKELDRIAAAASDCKEESSITLREMRSVVGSIVGRDLGEMVPFDGSAPRLSESWFCCAEPTVGQATAVGSIVLGRRSES